MLWYSAAVMAGLTLIAWWNGRQYRRQQPTAGMGKALYVAAILGAIGAVCFALAALI